MKIAVLSDTRLPTNLNYPGHGLGRSAARLAKELARRGNDVAVFGGMDSSVQWCKTVTAADENERAEIIAKGDQYFDAYIDSTHQHKLAQLRPDWPIVCKCCDKEGHAPNRRVYGSYLVKEWIGDGDGLVIHEGIDVDDIPFNGGKRGEHLLYPSTASWKRADVAAFIAGRAGRKLWLMGENSAVTTTPERVLPSATGEAYYRELANAAAVLSPIGTMATLEAAATGTPSIGMNRLDGWIEHGVSGWLATDELDAVHYVERLSAIDPKRSREWVAECRSVSGMAMWWERALERAMNGEVW